MTANGLVVTSSAHHLITGIVTHYRMRKSHNMRQIHPFKEGLQRYARGPKFRNDTCAHEISNAKKIRVLPFSLNIFQDYDK